MNRYEPFKPGQEVWLVPVLMTAPGAAYRRPACEVVRMATTDRVVLRLPDGSEVETDTRNVQRTPPVDREPRTGTGRRSRLVLPDGYAEQTLW